MNFSLRTATKDDAPAIVELLNYYIATTTSTFLIERQTIAERIAWFKEHSDKHPVVAVESDGNLIGWGALSPYNPRPGYRHTAEVSVYLHPGFHRHGIGRALLQELISRARARSIITCSWPIAASNQAPA